MARVIIDAGHGGQEPGAVYENRKEKLKRLGINVDNILNENTFNQENEKEEIPYLAIKDNEEEFAEMYFNLKKVEIEKIESFLQDLKRAQTKSDKMRKYATLIKLYCYLVDEKVKCGPKNKVPKGNKGLKTSNLKSLIAAA